VTAEQYRAEIRRLGLTPVKPSYDGATLHVGRDGGITSIPDAETLSPQERESFLKLLKYRMGVEDEGPD
jgi:hypothetical protein